MVAVLRRRRKPCLQVEGKGERPKATPVGVRKAGTRRHPQAAGLLFEYSRNIAGRQAAPFAVRGHPAIFHAIEASRRTNPNAAVLRTENRADCTVGQPLAL